MSDSRRTLFEWYDKYVGEAASRREVYGYWTFVLGYVVGISGVLVYLLGAGSPGSPLFLQIREVAIVLSAVGLALAMLGIVFQLPISSLGVWVALLGGAIAVYGVARFVTVYPENWLGAGTPQRTIIATYLAGVGLTAGVAVLVPVLTGERSFLLEEGFEDEAHPVLAGEAQHGGLFAVYRRGPADWAWRLLDQEAVADGTEAFTSRPDVEQGVEVVRSKVAEAGLMEINTAAFRLYGGDGTWRWDLMAEDGSALATSAGDFPDRDAAEESVSVLKEYGPEATVLTIEGASFTVERSGSRWRWTLVDEGRTPLAVAPDTIETEEAAWAATEGIRESAADADLLTVDHVGFEVRDGADGWTWRVLDDAGTAVGAGAATFDDRASVRDRVDEVREAVVGAPVVAEPDPHFELVASDGAWDWRFVDDGDEVVAAAHGGPTRRDDAAAAIDTFRDNAEDAPVAVGSDPAVELYRDDGGWRWRLVDADRTEIQRSVRAFDDREAVEEAVEHAVAETAAAELVEFEEAAFQLYEAEGGDWRWRLIEEGGELLSDSGEDYESREAAASGMTVLKENAPDAELLEIDSAAIELFREDGEWGWRIVDEEGETVAESQTRHESKAAATDAVRQMRSLFEDPATRLIRDGAFQVVERTDGDAAWRWRFVAADGSVVAEATRGHTTRERATRSVESLEETVPTAETHAVETFAFVLAPEDGEWGWRLVDRDREAVAHSDVAYADRAAVEDAVATVREHALDAAVFELTGPVYHVHETDDGWTWTLVDTDWERLTAAPDAFDDRAAAEAAAERVASLASDAGSLDYENAAFELTDREGGDWEWRLVDEDGRELAASPVSYEDREAAVAELDRLREVVGAASILEIESAAFELHEAEDESGWEWRLVDRTGETVARSVRTYPTRTDAREGMQSLKERAPDAGVVVAG